MCEVGFMQLSDEEIAGMREYLLRGGFLLVDDFRGSSHMRNFEYHVKRAFPEREYQIKLLCHDQVAGRETSLRTIQTRVPRDGRQTRPADDDHQLQQRRQRLLAM